jgi:hypothetical protein
MTDNEKAARPIMPSADEAEKETGIKRQPGEVPGGAEGGEESPSADKPLALPADDDAPLGDTDQHSRSS